MEVTGVPAGYSEHVVAPAYVGREGQVVHRVRQGGEGLHLGEEEGRGGGEGEEEEEEQPGTWCMASPYCREVESTREETWGLWGGREWRG